MAGAIMLAALLSQYITIACPLCGYRKRVHRRPAARRVCPRCRKYFDDPLTAK